jgi:hypothetical protein
MSSNNHPARDAEFLSRLHDGDLSAAERAHFESHRAHCAECRRAAAEFESALSLYRSSRPTPASPDLAGRILRKLQTGPGAPRRSRFGPSFGIDLRWAGAFAAAVVAAIVGSTIVGRHEAREGMARATGPAPIPIVVQSRAEATPPPAPGPVSSAPAQPKASEPPRRGAFAAGQASKNEVAAPKENPAAKEKKEQGPASSQDRLENAESGLAGKLAEAQPYREEDRTERQRAKLEAPAMMAQKAAPAPAAAAPAPVPATVRVRVEALDGIAAPEVAGDVRVPASLRGHSWILVVEPDGRVREAREQVALDKRADAAAKDEPGEAAPKEILDLRFTPGDRGRRVLVRVE